MAERDQGLVSAWMESLMRLAAVTWYASGLLFVLLLIRGPGMRAAYRAFESGGLLAWLDLGIAALAVSVVAAFFWLTGILGRRSVQALFRRDPMGWDDRFPAPATLVAGAWLIPISLGSAAALLIVLARPDWLLSRLPDATQSRILDALIVMAAAAVGGSISTILGYLRHASEDQDFELAFMPWYFARPLMAVLLGLVFFFLLRGGLFVALPQAPPDDLSDFGMAGIGALVGLFSKNAIEKLRELFKVLFATRADHDQELLRLARDLEESKKP
jgi:hypothetical protein